MTKEVDEYVKSSIRPDQRSIIAIVRKVVRESAPEARELITYGIIGWKAKRGKVVAVVNASKEHVTFSFAHGKEFKDRYGLLEGVGKVGRHVKMKDLKSVNKEALKYYIRQAIEIDGKLAD